MAGTVEGGKAAAVTNKRKYGEDFFAKIGAIGGKKGKTGGWYNNPEAASKAAKIGGKRSRKGHRFIRTDNIYNYYVRESDSEIVKIKIK